VQAIVHESEQVQSAIERAQNALYTSSGVILPVLTGAFVVAAKGTAVVVLPIGVLGLIFVITVSLGGMWSQYLWMELLRYTRYKHLVLLPRLYAATGQNGRNFLQTFGKQSVRMKLPILLFNVGCLIVLVATHVAFVSYTAWYLQVLSIAFIVSVVITTLAVFIEWESLVSDAVSRSSFATDKM
jgi:hypothetical protein